MQTKKSFPEKLSSFFTHQADKDFCDVIDNIIEEYMSDDTITSEASLKELFVQFGAESIPQEGLAQEEYLKEIKEDILPNIVKVGSPRFVGHMTGALPNFMGPLSKLVTICHQNMVKVETSKVLTLYEKQALMMLHELIFKFSKSFYHRHIHQSESTFGVICSGGTLANVLALQCARNSSLHAKGGSLSVEKDGLYTVLNELGYTSTVVIGSRLMHYSIEKAMGLLGMGAKQLMRINTDECMRVKVDEVRKALEHCRAKNIHISAIVGVAGTTDCGSVDPLSELADLANEFGVHFHVDAAWLGPLIFSNKYRHVLKDIERADSVTLDGHKQLYLPIGIGMAFFQDVNLAKYIEKSATYIIRKDSYDLGKRAIEGSRPAMVFYLQAALKIFGKQGYNELMEWSIETAQEIAELIQESKEFELMLPPETNIILFRYIPKQFRTLSEFEEKDNQVINRYNERIQRISLNSGKYFVSRTAFQTEDGQCLRVLRLVVTKSYGE